MSEQKIQIQVTPKQVQEPSILFGLACQKLGVSKSDFPFYKVLRRSIDARKRDIKFNVTIGLYATEKEIPTLSEFEAQHVSKAQEVAIIGAGPAGLFAALRCIQIGLKPIVFERGKDVRSRRRDLATLNKESIVNPESNYCFGEGGAGTYSDGKLYTRSKKRGSVLEALEWFVHFGADEDILVDAHPHIGTNKLPQIITAMREKIIEAGGEVRFENKLTDLTVANGELESIEINGSEVIPFSNLVLATGHSARDIFELLHHKNIKLLAKPFAIGVRIEHQQELIDTIQYHGKTSGDLLPPASYSLVEQVDGMGVYSFCMCPGGIIAPCATENGEVVTNGWSPSKRNNPYSNSGMVVSVDPEILPNYTKDDPFVSLNFQKSVEKACWEAAGKTQKVPAQRMIDFCEGKISKDFPRSSYQPGIESVDLNEVLPKFLTDRLKKAFKAFGNKMRGYYTNDAVLHAPESRTSSPVQIPREKDMQHPEVNGLYPCAEGAGYAGGIISAAIDGVKCIDAIAEKIGFNQEK